MKVILLLGLLTLVGCGNHPMVHEEKVYNCYGFMDRDDEHKDNVMYEISGSNMLGAVIFSETLIVPVWTLGWNTYCPVKVLAPVESK